MNQPSKAPRVSRHAVSAQKNKKKSRVELDQEARERKRLKKRRGHTAGSRTQVDAQQKQKGTGGQAKDPRLGSKVPVVLVIDRVLKEKQQTNVAVKQPQLPRLLPEQELAQLENDPRLDALLARLEAEEILSTQDQAYVDRMLDRIDELMTQLGIELDDDEEENEKEEDIFKLLKGGDTKSEY